MTFINIFNYFLIYSGIEQLKHLETIISNECNFALVLYIKGCAIYCNIKCAEVYVILYNEIVKSLINNRKSLSCCNTWRYSVKHGDIQMFHLTWDLLYENFAVVILKKW